MRLPIPARSCRIALLLALTLRGSPMPGQPTHGQAAPPDSGRYTIYKLQHAVGTESYHIAQSDSARQLTAQWSFRYLGTPVELTDLLSLSLASVRVADGSLRPIAHLRSLRRLELPLLFPASEFLMLEEALPDAQGQWRDLWRQYVRPTPHSHRPRT